MSKEAWEAVVKRIGARKCLDQIFATVDGARREVLAKPLPRDECPGCFLAIYDKAAKQGWCADCFPKRIGYIAALAASQRENSNGNV